MPGAQATAEVKFNQFVNAIGSGASPKTGDQYCSYGCPGLSQSDYLHLIIDPRLRKNQVTDKLVATQLVTDVEQIHVQHILTETKEGSLKIKAMLDQGADFSTLANTQSSEQIAKKGVNLNGGDLGWTSKDDSPFLKEFTDAAFKVPTGKYSDPVYTQDGYHIIKVLERDPKRPLDATTLATKKTKLYTDWLAKARDAAKISPAPTPTPAAPTQPPLVEPTVAPKQTPTKTGGTPGATMAITSTNTVATTTAGTAGTASATAANLAATPTTAASGTALSTPAHISPTVGSSTSSSGASSSTASPSIASATPISSSTFVGSTPLGSTPTIGSSVIVPTTLAVSTPVISTPSAVSSGGGSTTPGVGTPLATP
ncbi:MAG: peptidylprolyl isomerase [Chloroflexota bacterium]|nr:peptidylprolyl isomerase [Chloroflexota bacterium]